MRLRRGWHAPGCCKRIRRLIGRIHRRARATRIAWPSANCRRCRRPICPRPCSSSIRRSSLANTATVPCLAVLWCWRRSACWCFSHDQFSVIARDRRRCESCARSVRAPTGQRRARCEHRVAHLAARRGDARCRSRISSLPCRTATRKFRSNQCCTAHWATRRLHRSEVAMTASLRRHCACSDRIQLCERPHSELGF